ncbi:MAG: alpha/beta fold hydrolase [Rhodomicrobiaceae bacterium]
MRVQVNGTRLFFDTDGSGFSIVDGSLVPKQPLIALHGGPGFDHGYLRPGLGPLREHAQLIYLDLRGQGRSDPSPLDLCTLQQMADDVAEVCAVLEIERPIVFGHSFGGFVALDLAVRYPALLGGLILCNASATFPHVVANGEPVPRLELRAESAVVEIAQRVFNGDISAETVAAFMQSVIPFYASPSHMDVPAKILKLSSLIPTFVLHFVQTIAPGYDLRNRLGRIAAPTLLIAGKHDWICPAVASYRMKESIVGAKILELSEAGHFAFSEEPERFLNAVIAFLSGLQPPEPLPCQAP